MSEHQQKVGKEPRAACSHAGLDKRLLPTVLCAWPRVNNGGALGLVTGSDALFNYTLIERTGCR